MRYSVRHADDCSDAACKHDCSRSNEKTSKSALRFRFAVVVKVTLTACETPKERYMIH